MTTNNFRRGDVVRCKVTGRRHRVADAYDCAVWIEGGRSIHPTKLELV